MYLFSSQNPYYHSRWLIFRDVVFHFTQHTVPQVNYIHVDSNRCSDELHDKKVKGVKQVAIKVSSLPVDNLASTYCVCTCVIVWDRVCVCVCVCLCWLNDSLAPWQSGQLVSLTGSRAFDTRCSKPVFTRTDMHLKLAELNRAHTHTHTHTLTDVHKSEGKFPEHKHKGDKHNKHIGWLLVLTASLTHTHAHTLRWSWAGGGGGTCVRPDDWWACVWLRHGDMSSKPQPMVYD